MIETPMGMAQEWRDYQTMIYEEGFSSRGMGLSMLVTVDTLLAIVGIELHHATSMSSILYLCEVNCWGFIVARFFLRHEIAIVDFILNLVGNQEGTATESQIR